MHPCPSEILVTIRTNRHFYDISIDPLHIDFINPGLGDCMVHFTDGSYLYIYSGPKGINETDTGFEYLVKSV